MMSPPQIQQILFNFPFSDPLSENEITQQVIIPCLQKISMSNGYKFRGLHFTGGRDEQGTDIEYYEMIGPDSYYNEFVSILQVPPMIAGQSNSVTTLYDANDPPVLASDFAATDWTTVD